MKTREIKFRAWDKENKRYWYFELFGGERLLKGLALSYLYSKEELDELINSVQQYTGLKDKQSLTEVYEDDIIDTEGNIKGNIYEMDKEKTDLVIQGFGTKDWFKTYNEAIHRGCQNAE